MKQKGFEMNTETNIEINEMRPRMGHWSEQIEALTEERNQLARHVLRLEARLQQENEEWRAQFRQGVAIRIREILAELWQDSVPACRDIESGEPIYHQCMRPVEEIEADLLALAGFLDSNKTIVLANKEESWT